MVFLVIPLHMESDTYDHSGVGILDYFIFSDLFTQRHVLKTSHVCVSL